ncbi:hypothetical protein JNJ66_04105 [Candidatus Saccharibacteria bacterium]|nr:hypothetical protein [Candidatus Saccharibacteria bacterium]
MQTTTLIKLFTETHVAHLYEHFVAYHLHMSLKTKRLIEYIDYEYSAATYGGYVLLDITASPANMPLIVNTVQTLGLDFRDDEISSALSILALEEDSKLSGEILRIKEKLNEVHGSDWIHLDDIGILPVGTQGLHETRRQKFSTLNVVSEPVAAAPINVNFVLQPLDAYDVQRDFPLFQLMTNILHDNIGHELIWLHQMYFTEGLVYKKAQSVVNQSVYLSHHTDDGSRERILATCSKAVAYLLNLGFSQRFAQYLRDVSYDEHGNAPKEEDMVRSFHILVGGRGWRSMADANLIQPMIKNMVIEVQDDNATSRLSLQELCK